MLEASEALMAAALEDLMAARPDIASPVASAMVGVAAVEVAAENQGVSAKRGS